MQPVFLHRSSARIPKGGGHDSILRTILTYYALLAPQRGGHGTMCAITLYNIENYVTNSVKKRNIEKLCHKQREKK